MKIGIRILFLVAALYDGVLGLAFLVAAPRIYEWAGVAPPNHWGYIHFPALLLLVFAFMFLRIAMAPGRRRELILYACGLKIAYCGTVFYHLATTGIPSLWVIWAWVDLVCLVLFLAAWWKTAPSRWGSLAEKFLP